MTFWLTLVALLASGLGDGAMTQAPLDVGGVVRKVIEQKASPRWLSLPDSIGLRLPPGVRLERVAIGVVSHENPRQAALIGVLRNAGEPLSAISLTMAFIDGNGALLGPAVPSVSRVSTVAAGALLPFRFPLKPGAPAGQGIRLRLETGALVNRRPLLMHMDPGYKVRPLGQRGMQVLGNLTLAPAVTPPDRSENVAVTLTLHDERGDLLDVIAGETIREDHGGHGIDLTSMVPMAGKVKAVRVYAEALASSP
jgi:hypothetical protein